MKFWDLLRTANSSLWRNKLRTFLTIIAIFVGGFVITLMVGVNAGVNDYIHQQVGGIGGDNLILVMAKQDDEISADSGPKKYDPNASTAVSNITENTRLKMLTDADIAKIKGADSRIADVSPDLSPETTWVAGENGTKYVLQVGEKTPGLTVSLAAGKATDDNSAENEVLIYTDDVATLGFANNDDAIGKKLAIGVSEPNGQIREISAKIVGVQNRLLFVTTGDGDIPGNRVLAQTMRDIQMTGITGPARTSYGRASVVVKDGLTKDEITAVQDKIANAGYYAVSIQAQMSTVYTIINAITTALIGFGAIALLAASFGIINTLFMSVQERTREIGLMKAMGMSRRKVFILFALEAVLIGFWGSLVSVLAAIGAGNVINIIATKTFLDGLDGFELLKFPLISVLGVVFVVMLIAFLAGTLPARRASRKDPIEALRYE